jgi:hypothetical protein
MDNAQVQPLAVRRAAVADAAALTRLREAMLSDMGMLAAGTGQPRRSAGPHLQHEHQLRLADPGARH